MSEENNKKQIAVGAFIFIGLAILVIGIFTIGGQRKAFVKSFHLVAIFEDAQGLQAGNNVWLSGIKVGTVKKVAFNAGSGIEMILNVDKDARSHIHKNATARVSTDGLVGNKILVIDDDPLFRSLITSMLRHDYLVTVAGDGAEGFAPSEPHPNRTTLAAITRIRGRCIPVLSRVDVPSTDA